MFKIFSVIFREQRIGCTPIDIPIKFSNDTPKIDEKSLPILGENNTDICGDETFFVRYISQTKIEYHLIKSITLLQQILIFYSLV